jgi:hypothetical protein
MNYFVYEHLENEGLSYPKCWKLVGTFTDINEADKKAVQLCGNNPYETEPRGSELKRGFFGRKDKVTWDAMILTKLI